MVKSRFFSLVGIFFLFVYTAKAQQPTTPEGVTAIKAGRVIDVENGRVLEKQIILLRGKKIEAIGGELKIPAAAKILYLSTKTLLPGLIDCHTHLADGAHDGDPTSQLKRTASQVVLESVQNARMTLESG